MIITTSRGEEIKVVDGICHCPIEEIEWCIGADKNGLFNQETGKCKRCFGLRLGKNNNLLTLKRKIK